MKLIVAGGCGEHGRNCFFVDCGDVRFLVDCGIMAGEVGTPGGGYPHLTQEQISSLDYVFLTHSHADHSGALQWLGEQGYAGPLIATRETILQCEHSLPINYYLSTICPGGHGSIKNMDITWGRSGHCEGSVWYKISVGGKSVLFSGDYTENTCLYRCDALRGQTADLAVLDCAYGNDTTSYEEYCASLLERTKALLASHKLLLFPVPKYGRGPELLKLFSDNLQDDLNSIPFYGDTRFINDVNSLWMKAFWYQTEHEPEALARPYGGEVEGIVFVSDPQLRTQTAQRLANGILAQGGTAIATGKVDVGSYSAAMMAKGQMVMCRYPVHLNRAGYERLKSTNHFTQAIPYHSDELKVHSPISF